MARPIPQPRGLGGAPEASPAGSGDASPYSDFFRDRLIFTILSSDGKVLGFSGRGLDDSVQPKYLNSPESPLYRKGDTLLGIQAARPAIREKDQAVIVEGNFDLIRLHQEGIRNVVAPLGTAFTEEHARVLSRSTRNFVLLFDGDDAGVRAANRALEIFLPMGILPRAVLLPRGEDPDSFVKNGGVEPLIRLIAGAPLLLDLRIEHIFAKAGEGVQERGQATKEILALISKLPGEVEKSLYYQIVADRFGLSEGLLAREAAGKKREARKERNFLAPPGDDKGSNLPPIERMVLEVLLSGSGNPEILFREIGEGDFSHPGLGQVWGLLKADFTAFGTIVVARILEGAAENRGLLTALTVSGNGWKEGPRDAEAGGGGEAGKKAAFDCVRQVRTTRLKERLRGLSREIRKAELECDSGRMQDLLGQKNRLIKEMTTLH